MPHPDDNSYDRAPQNNVQANFDMSLTSSLPFRAIRSCRIETVSKPCQWYDPAPLSLHKWHPTASRYILDCKNCGQKNNNTTGSPCLRKGRAKSFNLPVFSMHFFMTHSLMTYKACVQQAKSSYAQVTYFHNAIRQCLKDHA